MNLLRLLLFWIIFTFLCFPSYAYDEKIKLNRTYIETDSNKETIKINLNGMLDLRKIKKVNKKYASTERYVKAISRKIVKKGKKIKYRGVFADNVNAVVYIGNEHEKGTGAGSIIDSDGLVLTNWHVIGQANEVKIWMLPKDKEKKEEENLWSFEPYFIGKVVKKSKRKDLALIQVVGFPKNLKVIEFGTDEDIVVEAPVTSIGHPVGLTWSSSKGWVSQYRPNHQWSYKSSRHRATVVQHQSPISAGNSGGPLFNENGKLIGVNSYISVDGQNLNFAVAISEVIEFIAQEQVEEEKPKYIEKKKKPTYITKKCKEKNKYLQKKCKKEQSSKAGDGIKKTYPNAIAGDVNGNGIEDVWYIDDNKNGKIDTAFVDHDEDGIIEAIMVDDNENKYFEIITIDKDLNGYPDLLYIDRDEDGEDDVVAYDYNEDGEWDKYEKPS